MVPANVDLVNSGSHWLQGTLVDFKICSNNYSSQTNEAVSKMWVNLHFDTASLFFSFFKKEITGRTQSMIRHGTLHIKAANAIFCCR